MALRHACFTHHVYFCPAGSLRHDTHPRLVQCSAAPTATGPQACLVTVLCHCQVPAPDHGRLEVHVKGVSE